MKTYINDKENTFLQTDIQYYINTFIALPELIA